MEYFHIYEEREKERDLNEGMFFEIRRKQMPSCQIEVFTRSQYNDMMFTEGRK
jgi:hypothetical protein